MSRVDELSREILETLLSDFAGRNLTTKELEHGYVGVSVNALKQTHCCTASDGVDFDLSLKELESKHWIDTGPMEPYKNHPNSGVFVVGIFSKREYVFLTEKGYKEVKRLRSSRVPKSSPPHVHISGGTFHQSPIGIGANFTQSVVKQDCYSVFSDLRNAIAKGNLEETNRAKLLAGVDAMRDSESTPTFLDRYKEFVSLAADHMTIIAPFLPALSALLGK
ncbi:MAG TPA: hypothetical protein VGR55_13610 [Candidatus Acidoferrum sp.]|nr:hypothetical protein [Candidatus Acidoferrum sp.]